MVVSQLVEMVLVHMVALGRRVGALLLEAWGHREVLVLVTLVVDMEW